MICERCGQGGATNVLAIWCGTTGRTYQELWCLPCLLRMLRREGYAADLAACDSAASRRGAVRHE